MNSQKNLSSLVVGLALFSMFFGAGNLIFPLFVGQLAQGQWMTVAFGFLLTAVVVPFFGVIAMVVFRGNFTEFFSCFGRVPGFLLTLLLLTVWIPLGSAPRCITLAYASLTAHFPASPPMWMFSLGYCLCVSLVIYKKNRMLEILGRFLTPLLLCCLALIIFMGLQLPSNLAHSSFSHTELFSRGLKEGYNTMDLIASFFFSASIIDILRKSSHDENASLKKALKASAIGILILGAVYIGMISLAALHTVSLQGVPKDQLLVHIAKTVLGSHLGVIAALAIFLACFTTSVALVSVYADFISEKVFRSPAKYTLAIILTQIVSFGMSIFGLQGITFVTEPILQIFYPLLIVLIFVNVGRQFWRFRMKKLGTL